MAAVTVFLLPNRPESTTFLTERERAIAIDRMNRSTSGDTGATVQRGTRTPDGFYLWSAHVYALYSPHIYGFP
jgi:hypothetical protein